MEVLERCLNEIVRRHASLRTTFAMGDDEPVQRVAPSLEVPLPVVDLRDLPPEQRDESSLRLATEEARKPFDLAEGPLVRSTLLHLDEDSWVLLLTMHHIVSDGWSMGVLSSALRLRRTRGRERRRRPGPPCTPCAIKADRHG